VKDRREMLARRHNRRCGSKQRFDTQGQAEFEMKLVLAHPGRAAERKRQGYANRAAQAYHCKTCGFWHWGHI